MRFELAEFTVLAEEDHLEAKAEEAVELFRKSPTDQVYLECRGVAVLVGLADTPAGLVRRWQMHLDFFGLHRRQRKSLYRAIVRDGMPVDDAARKVGVSADVAHRYAREKGWRCR